MTLQVSQILFDVHIPVSLKVFTRGDFLVKRMKWYQICPSRLSYYFVINEVESCTISFLGILQIDDLLQWQEVEDTAQVGEREIRSPVQCPASFVNSPGMKPPLHFSFGLSFLNIETWVTNELMLLYTSKESVTYPEQARMMFPFTELLKCLT